jgi:hypothetical protein
MTANTPIDTHVQSCTVQWHGSRTRQLTPPRKRYRGGIYLPATTATTVSLGAQSSGGLMTGKAHSGSTRIRTLNDELRRFGRGGRIMITPGIQALGVEGVARVLTAVAAFDAFTGDSDPYGEHDCAILAVDGTEVLFKIDCYDRDLVCHSPNPSDPTVTQRVMVVMFATEY